MKTLVKAAAAIALLAAGVLAGRVLSRPAAGEDAGKAGPSRVSRSSAGHVPAQEPTVHGVEQLRHRLALYGRDGGVHAAELARLDVPALQELALRAAEGLRPGDEDTEEGRQRAGLIAAVMKELYDRLGVGALEWAASTEEGVSRQRFYTHALNAAVRDDAVLAEPWVARFRKEYPDVDSGWIFRAALAGAKGRSAEDMLHIARKLATEKDLAFTLLVLGGYADDFDFGALCRGMPQEIRMEGVVRFWAGRDPEGAWKAVQGGELERSGQRDKAFSAVLEGAVAQMGETSGVEWAVARLREVAEDDRSSVVEGLAKALKSREAVLIAAGQLDGENGRDFAEAIYRGGMNDTITLDVLGTLPREDLIVVMEKQRRFQRSMDNSGGDRGMNQYMKDRVDRQEALFTAISQRFSFTPDEISRMEKN